MLEQLFNLVRQESQQEIIDNPAIPNEHNNEAVGLATESVFNGLQGALANGGLQDVLGLFGGNSSVNMSNPLVGGIADNFIGSLMKKFGIDSPMAKSIAATLIPTILGKLISRTNDPNDNGFDINGIIGALTGAGSGSGGVQIPGLQNAPANGNSSGGIDFGGILKSLTSGGLDANRDGKIGLDDISGMISGAASNAQQNNQQQGGGVLGMLKGLLGG